MSRRTFFEMAIGEAGKVSTDDGEITRTGDKTASLTGHWPKQLLDRWRDELKKLEVDVSDEATSD